MTLVMLEQLTLRPAIFGGPLAYTPYNAATATLAGPGSAVCAMTHRRPGKHPYSDFSS